MALSISILIGLVLGLTGAGGSIFAVPLFMLFLGLSINDAIGIGLGAVAIASFVGIIIRCYPSIEKSNLAWTPGFFLAISGMATAPFGRWIGQQSNETFLLLSFTALANILAIRMWLQAQNDHKATFNVRSSSNARVENTFPAPFESSITLQETIPLSLFGAGMVIGILSGLFGVGGGFLIVPLLIFHMNMNIQQAIGTSLIVIFLISSAGFFFHISQVSKVPLDLLLQASLGSITGILLGTAIAIKIVGPFLQKVFAVSVVLLTASTLVKSLG